MNLKGIVCYKELLEDIVIFNVEYTNSRVFGQYYCKTELWELIKKSIGNEILIKLMIFTQSLNIAPLHTLIEYYKDELINNFKCFLRYIF